MTQFTPGFSQQYSGYEPQYAAWTRLHRSAKRAGVLMIVLASLLALYGVCNGLAITFLPKDQMMAQANAMGEQAVSADTVKIAGMIVSIGMVLFAATKIIVGIFCLKVKNGAVITGIILSIVELLLLGLFALIFLVMGLRNPVYMVMTVGVLIPIGLTILQMVWLIQAVKASGPAQLEMHQYQAQYHQYMQQQQQYSYAPQQAPATPPAMPQPPTPPVPPQ